jgi:hypothetical protein
MNALMRWMLWLGLLAAVACHGHTTEPTPPIVQGPPAVLEPSPDSV